MKCIFIKYKKTAQERTSNRQKAQCGGSTTQECEPKNLSGDTKAPEILYFIIFMKYYIIFIKYMNNNISYKNKQQNI